MLQQTFVFPLTASSVLTNVVLVQWSRCKEKKVNFDVIETILTMKGTEVWMPNQCWFGGYADWFWLWHRHTATFICISSSASIDACCPCR